MDTWAHVIARLALHLDLELVRGGGGDLICRVPTVAPGITLGEAANPRVGPTFFPIVLF
jgi:hypothetical protein